LVFLSRGWLYLEWNLTPKNIHFLARWGVNARHGGHQCAEKYTPVKYKGKILGTVLIHLQGLDNYL
jgi:hypothetical protein